MSYIEYSIPTENILMLFTLIFWQKIYISFVFINADLRHKIQLAATVMHERLVTTNTNRKLRWMKRSLQLVCPHSVSENQYGSRTKVNQNQILEVQCWSRKSWCPIFYLELLNYMKLFSPDPTQPNQTHGWTQPASMSAPSITLLLNSTQ